MIRISTKPITAQYIKQQLVEVGIKKDDIDRYWKRVQPALRLHPQIVMADKKYEWLAERRSAQSSLDLLTGRLRARQPSWLTSSWIQNVTDALARSGAGHSAWPERQYQQARLVADLAVAVDNLQTCGGTLADVSGLFAEEARRKRLWPIGQPGDSVAFDPAEHSAAQDAQAPEPGTIVRVIRSGYKWRGDGKPAVAAKAV